MLFAYLRMCAGQKAIKLESLNDGQGSGTCYMLAAPLPAMFLYI